MSHTKVLHAWIRGEYVGYFEKPISTSDAKFVYDQSAQHQVSLSLLKDGHNNKRAAQHYLDGLIPEHSGARENMRTLTGAKSTNSWDLLAATGGDLPGGIVLSPDVEGVHRDIPYTSLALVPAIEARIVSIHQGGTGLDLPESGNPRFSLAGAQGKFALVDAGDAYYWPDAATPSTHIVKPARKDHRGLNEVEARALNLADAMGVPASVASVARFGEQETFVVKRFDRETLPDGTIVRVHVEDIAQALGKPPEHKYDISVLDVVGLLREHGVDDDADYQFIKQLAFNVVVGNADAHGKNYSLIHYGNKVALSPLYDTVPISLFPEFNQDLGMKIGKKRDMGGVVPSDWVQLSKDAGFDTDRVLAIVREVDESFLEHAETFIGDTETGKFRREEFEKLLIRAERSLKRNPKP